MSDFNVSVTVVSPEPPDPRLEKRRLVAEILIIAFVAVAYHEALNTLRESLAHSTDHWFEAAVTFAVFFLTGLRFFIGNHLLLQSEVLLNKPTKWSWDLLFVLLQTLVLGFLGCVSPVDDKQPRDWFVALLLLLYAIDVAWIFGPQLLEKRWTWVGYTWPWQWGLLNAGLLVATPFVCWYFGDIYSQRGLLFLLLVNGVLAFVIDLLMDLPQLFKDPRR